MIKRPGLTVALILAFLFGFWGSYQAVSQQAQKIEEKFVKEASNEVKGSLHGKVWTGETVHFKVLQLLKRIQIKVRVSIMVNGELRSEFRPLKETKVQIRWVRNGKLVTTTKTDPDGFLPEADTRKIGVGEYALRPVTEYPKEPYYYASTFELKEDDRNKELELPLDFSSVIFNVLTGKPVNGAMLGLHADDGELVNGPFAHLAGSRLNPAPTGVQMSGGVQNTLEPPRFDLFAGEFQYKNPDSNIQAQSLQIKALVPERKYFVSVDFLPGSGLENKFMPITPIGGEWGEYDKPYRGETFRLLQDQPVGVQIPLVPIQAIKITKMANKTRAQMGDIVAYKIKAENMSEDDTNPNQKITIIDDMPVGIKYLKGTARMHGQVVEPSVQGNRLVFELDPLKAKNNPQKLDTGLLVYMCTLATSVVSGQVYENKAFAQIQGVTVSNISTAALRVDPSPFADESVIIGKVFIDHNGNGWQDEDDKGVGGIRLVMEDGTIVITDPDGKYSIPQVKAGRHVIKMDTSTIPRGLESASYSSRFVLVSKGLIAKQNFTLKEVSTPQSKASADP